MMSTGSTGSLFNIGSPVVRPLSAEAFAVPRSRAGVQSVARLASGSPRADDHLPDGRMCRLFSCSRN
jgi:hypothetical protein